MDTEKYLEYLQMICYKSNKDLWRLPARLDMEEVKNNILQEISDSVRKNPLLTETEIESSISQYKEFFRSVPNRAVPSGYEHLASVYPMLEILAKEIETTVTQDSGLKFSGNNTIPIFGILPTGNLNAMSIAVPDSNDSIIVFEDEIFPFCNLLSKVVARCMPFEEYVDTDSGKVKPRFSLRIPDIEKCISENSQIVDRFQDLMKSYLIGGKASAAKRYILEDLYSTPAIILRRSMELFVMGHEYSHVLAGHVDRRQIVPRSLAEHQVNEIRYPWEQEHQADILGSSLAILAMKRYEKVDFAFSYWGADIFFTALDTIEKGKIILSTGEKNYNYDIEEHSSHPPPLSRRDLLREVASSASGEKSIEPAVVVQKIVEILWADTVEFLNDLYQKGARLDGRFIQKRFENSSR